MQRASDQKISVVDAKSQRHDKLCFKRIGARLEVLNSTTGAAGSSASDESSRDRMGIHERQAVGKSLPARSPPVKKHDRL